MSNDISRGSARFSTLPSFQVLNLAFFRAFSLLVFFFHLVGARTKNSEVKAGTFVLEGGSTAASRRLFSDRGVQLSTTDNFCTIGLEESDAPSTSTIGRKFYHMIMIMRHFLPSSPSRRSTPQTAGVSARIQYLTIQYKLKLSVTRFVTNSH